MIHSIRMINFKQHRDLTVHFHPGLNAIQGDNGGGKTTILKALLFAWFGATAAGSKEHLATWGENNTEVTVDQDLSTLGRITITRSLTKATVVKDGEVLASGQVPVTRFIESQLGMDARMFKSMLYAGQGDAQALVRLGAADLQRKLETVANIGTVDSVVALITADLNTMKGELQALGDPGDLTAMEGHVEALGAEVSNLGDQVDCEKAELEELKTRRDEATQYLKSVTEQYQAHERYRTESNRLQTLLTEATNKCQVLESTPVTQPVTTVANAEQAAREAGQRYHDLSTRLKNQEGWQKTKTRLLQEKAVVDRMLQHIPRATELKTAAEAAKQELAEANDQLRATQAALVAATCKGCGRPFDENGLARLRQQEAEQWTIVGTRTPISLQAESDLSAFLAETGLTGRDLARLEFESIGINKQLEQLQDLESEDVTQEDITKAQEEYHAANNYLGDVSRAWQQWTTWSTHLQEARTTVAAHSKALEKLAEQSPAACEYADVVSAQQALQSWQMQLEEQSRTLTGVERDLADVRSAWLLASAQLEKAKAKRQRVLELEFQISLRNQLVKYLRDNRSKLMSDTWTALTHYASHLTSTITEGLITNLSRDDSGDFYVNEGEQRAPVEELSGARKSIVGLALRLSLAHLFYGDQGVVLLDEVTADCTEANAARVAGLLKSLQSQVIMVTHRQGDAVNANHTVTL